MHGANICVRKIGHIVQVMACHLERIQPLKDYGVTCENIVREPSKQHRQLFCGHYDPGLRPKRNTRFVIHESPLEPEYNGRH